MAKGRDNKGREEKKKKKPKKTELTGPNPDVSFRHHSVVAAPPAEAPRSTE